MAGRTESEQSEEQAITGDSAEPPSHLEKQIIRQVEYYYGDHNIVKDKFLRDQVGPNYDKWVPLETMIKFKRLADLSTDFDVIISALQKSTSGLIEISDDRKSIRRSPSHAVPLLTSEYRTETKARTVYAKGFPPEITFDQLQEFFDQHGKIVAIHMRRNAEKEFKGSVFIEFVDISEAKQFVEAATVQYEDSNIERQFKANYWQNKEKERREKKDEERKARLAARAEKKAKDKSEKTETKDGEDENPLNDQEKAENDEEEETRHDTGCILHFQNVGEQTSREDLKELFHEKEEVCWVDFARGDTSGHVRFKGDGSAKRAMDSLLKEHGGKLEIRGVETILRVVEGKEEEEYWKKVSEERKKTKAKKGQKRGRGRGGRGGSAAKRPRRNEN